MKDFNIWGIKDMKFLIIVNDLRNGGVERVLSILANYLSDQGHKVSFLAITNDNVSYKLNNNIEYEYVPYTVKDHRISLKSELCGMKMISQYMKEKNPDWLIAFDDSIIIRSVSSAWLQRRKILVSERLDPAAYKNIILKIARQVSYDMATNIVFQTPDAQAYFPKHTQKKSCIIPNPLSEELPYWEGGSSKDIVMACRLREQKNVPMAIEAFTKFHEDHPNYRLMIYGEGRMQEQLQKMIKDKHMKGSIVLAGYTTNIHEIMSKAYMYVSSSDYEGLSNSMIEALAMGVPCVVTDCPVGGARMFITNGENGFLTPVGDAYALCEAMSKLAEDKELANRFSEKSIKIRDELNHDAICQKWSEIIK